MKYSATGKQNLIILAIITAIALCCLCFKALLSSTQHQQGERSNRTHTLTSLPMPTPTRMPVVTPTRTPAPTSILTATPIYTPTPTPTPTPTSIPTATPTSTPIPTSTPTATPVPTSGTTPTPERVLALVVEVVDGDTIKVELDGLIYTVRYIGIDCPETRDPNRPVEWMGPEAAEANRRLVDGQIVYLEKDVSETDRYGRLLRYVFLANGVFVNAELVRQGYAQVSTYPPDVRYQSLFLEMQREAREAGRGLWGPTPVPTRRPSPPPAPPAPAPVCDCSGNIYNCSDFPTHAAAQACYNYCRSLGKGDIHRLDRDKDGVACESLP